MKKILSVMLILMLSVTIVASVASVTGGAASSEYNTDVITVDFEDYALGTKKGARKGEMINRENTAGDWRVFAETSEDVTGIVDLGGEHGNVLFYDSNGTYGNIAYVPNGTNNYNIRNFTVEYEMFVGDESASTMWFGLYGRFDGEPHDYRTGNGAVFYAQRGSDGKDAYVRGSYALASGGTNTASGLGNEANINKDFGYYRRNEGGEIIVEDDFNDPTRWYDIKVVFCEDFITGYMREGVAEGEEENEWFCFGTAVQTGSANSVSSGTIAFGCNLMQMYIDNIVITPQHGNTVTAMGMNMPAGSIAKSMTPEAGAESELELLVTGLDGYTFDRWYKSPDLTDEIVPTSIVLEEYVIDEAYGKFEWIPCTTKGAQLTLTAEDIAEGKTLYDIMDETEIDGEVWKDYFSGSQYRMRVYSNTQTNGFVYYTTLNKKNYEVQVYSAGNGTVSINDTRANTAIKFTDTDAENPGMEFIGKLEYDAIMEFSAIPATGYKFAGWYEEFQVRDSLTQQIETYTRRLSRVGEDYPYQHNVYSKRVIKATFIEEDAEEVEILPSILPSAQYGYFDFDTIEPYFVGEEISLIAGEKVNEDDENIKYAFVAWYWGERKPENAITEYKDGEYVNAGAYHNIVLSAGTADTNGNGVNDLTLISFFEIETYRVYINNNIGGAERVEHVGPDSRVTLLAPSAPEGYVFQRWNVIGADYTTDGDTVTFTATGRVIEANAIYSRPLHTVKVSYDKTLVDDITQFRVALVTGDTATLKVTPIDGYCVSSYSLYGVDATINDDTSLSFVVPDENVTIRVEFRTTDYVHQTEEIIMYAAFTALALVVVAAVLFQNKDKSRERQH